MSRPAKITWRHRANDAAEKIEVAGRSTIEAVHECGLLLLEAKQAIPHGEFTEWLSTEFKHGERQARRYMAIGKLDLIEVVNCNTIHEALKINSPQKAAKPESKSATKSDLTHPEPDANRRPEPQESDDFGDLPDTLPIRAVEAVEAVEASQAEQVAEIQQLADQLLSIQNIAVAAKCLRESLGRQSDERQATFRDIWDLLGGAA